jgi:acyl-coenzyme A synthetase/AMP-(fatty) acid ligase
VTTNGTSREWWGASLLHGGADRALWACAATAVTRGQARDRVDELARLFAIQGVRRESTVALQIPPSFTWMWTLLALWSHGAQVMLIDHRMRAHEVRQLFRLCRPQFHIRSGPPTEVMRPFRDEREVLVEYKRDGLPAQDDYVLYQFSSGSMGRPKVIGRTAESLLAEVDRFARIPGMPARGERVLLLNSLSHAFGLVGGYLHALNVGAALVFPPRIRARDFLAVAADRRVNVVFGVPAHFDLFSRIGDPPQLPHLRMVASGGEMLARDVYDRFERGYGLRIGQAYGMTEVGIIAADLAGERPPPSVGHPAPGIEVRVEDGELYVRLNRSPYARPPAESRWSDGWLRTFDLAVTDPDTGALAINGRADSVTVVGGLNVDLTEVEAALRTHDRVADAVVVRGEVIEAHVAAVDRLTERDLAAWCRERLSGHKIPKRFYVVPELPRTTNGKLIRSRELLHAAYAGAGRVGAGSRS